MELLNDKISDMMSIESHQAALITLLKTSVVCAKAEDI